MKYIASLIWALIIGSTLAYILSSMKEDPFLISQAVTYSLAVFIIVTLIDAVLGPVKETTQE